MILGVLRAKDDLNPARMYRQSDQNKPLLALKLSTTLPNKIKTIILENLDTARTISIKDVSTARKIVKNYSVNSCKIKVFYYHINDINLASRVNKKCSDYSLPYQK